MLLGIICCRFLKDRFSVEDGLKFGCDEGVELVSSDSYFEGDIDDKLEGVNNVSVIKDGKR